MADYFDGFDSAPAEDRSPWIAPASRAIVQLTGIVYKSMPKTGLTMVVKFDIVESSSPEDPAGSARCFTITKFDASDAIGSKARAMGKAKMLLAALFGLNATDNTQPWTKIIRAMTENEGARGAEFVAAKAPNKGRFRVQADARTQSQGGNMYTPIHTAAA